LQLERLSCLTATTDLSEKLRRGLAPICSLLCFEEPGIFIYVSQKEIVLDVIKELPDEVSLEQIAEKIEFLAAIKKGMDQLDRGEGIPHEEVKRQLATWLAS
jgi:hypothetical protein